MARHCKETHRRDDAGAHALALINPSPLLLACQFADALAAMPDMKSVARTDKDIALFESHKIIIASLFCQIWHLRKGVTVFAFRRIGKQCDYQKR